MTCNVNQLDLSRPSPEVLAGRADQARRASGADLVITGGGNCADRDMVFVGTWHWARANLIRRLRL